jgi:hypothetical protein
MLRAPLRVVLLSAWLQLSCSDAGAPSPTSLAGGSGATSAGASSAGGGAGAAAGSSAGGAGAGAGAGSGGASTVAGNDAGGAAGSAGEQGSQPPAWPIFCASVSSAPTGDQWQTERVFYENGKLSYATDAQQNRIPDYSYAGYRYGQQPLPVALEAVRVSAADGDDTARIQEALDAVAALEPNAQGLRGAVVLDPGVYEIAGTIRIDGDGVVLRGSGSGDDPAVDSVLQIVGNSPASRAGVLAGSGDGSPWSTGEGTKITTPFVPVGSLSFDVEDASGFAVGDDVMVRHPSSQAWIDAVEGGSTGADAAWSAGSMDLYWIRKIAAIEGNAVTLDAPIFNHLDSALTQSLLLPISERNLRSHVGVEDLRVDIQTLGGEDEAHAWDAVRLAGVEDSWVRNVTALHFTQSGVETTGALRVTVQDCTAIEPVGVRTGGRFYNFDAEGNSQLILFTENLARDGRHNMIANGTESASGIVFHRTQDEGDSASEAHRQWTQGMLYDSNYGETSDTIQLISRGDYGTGHGWAGVHSVIWNYTGTMRVQQPPTAQNYAFSSQGTLQTSYPFPGPDGEADVRDTGELFPPSLYEAQLCERLAQ